MALAQKEALYQNTFTCCRHRRSDSDFSPVIKFHFKIDPKQCWGAVPTPKPSFAVLLAHVSLQLSDAVRHKLPANPHTNAVISGTIFTGQMTQPTVSKH